MKKYFVKHLCPIPPPFGGVSVFVKRLVLALCENNLVSGAFFYRQLEGVPKSISCVFDFFPKHVRSIWALYSIFPLVKICNNYRILHNHLSLDTCFITWLLHRLLHIPVVFTVHNQMIDREFENMSFFDNFFFQKLASDSKVQFIAVNLRCKELLQKEALLFANEVLVLPAYIPPVKVGNCCDYMPDSLYNFLNTDNKKILFYAESITSYNGIDIYGLETMLRLFNELKSNDCKLQLVVCISSVPSTASISFFKSLLPDSISNSVYWQLGPLPEMWPLYELSSLLIRPTCTDGDSVMIREALSLGLPVLASDVSKRPKGCSVYRFGEDLDLLNKATSLLSSNQRLIFSQHSIFDDMLTVYHSLLKNS